MPVPDVEVGEVEARGPGRGLARAVRLCRERDVRVVLDQHPRDVVPAGGDEHVARAVDCQLEPGVAGRAAGGADRVGGRREDLVPRNSDLLVPVRVEVDTPLLPEHTPVVPLRPEGLPREIALHDVLPFT